MNPQNTPVTAAGLPVFTAGDPFMAAAYDEAVKSYLAGGIPIGAVLVKDGGVIGRGHNSRFQEGNPIIHGEMSAYRDAGRLSPSVYRETTLYTTQPPCSMCAGTTLLFGLPRVVIGETFSLRTVPRDNNDYLGSGKSCPDFLRSLGLEVTVIDDPAPYELLRRFAAEKPDVWAEDIGDDGDLSDWTNWGTS
jgi:cytosine/creatinine deaminase